MNPSALTGYSPDTEVIETAEKADAAEVVSGQQLASVNSVFKTLLQSVSSIQTVSPPMSHRSGKPGWL
jgi:hypothetical protein